MTWKPVAGPPAAGTPMLRYAQPAGAVAAAASSAPAIPSSAVKLMLHGNGANLSTTFTDSSASARTITRTGSPVISTTQSKFGGAAMKFAVGDALKVPTSTDFAFAADFSVEFFVYFNTIPSDIYFLDKDGTANGFAIERVSGNLRLVTNAVTPVTGPWSPTTATWYHVALFRFGRLIALAVNGVIIGISVYTAAINTGGIPLRIAQFGSTGSFGVDGYIDDFRIIQGYSPYSSDGFTVPASALTP